MQVHVLQRIGVVLKDWRKAPVTACLCVVFLLLAKPAGAQPVATVVSASQQSARDGERLRILRDELRKSEALVESLAKRKAERLAVADQVAADEAEEGRLRTLGDIAALNREIAGTRSSADALAKAAPPASSPHPAPVRPASPKPTPTTPWWDVYGKARRADTPASVPYAQPPGSTAARTDSTLHME